MSNVDIRKYNRCSAKELRAVLKEELLHQESLRKENLQLLEENDILHGRLRASLPTVTIEAFWKCPECNHVNAVEDTQLASGGELECGGCYITVVAE